MNKNVIYKVKTIIKILFFILLIITITILISIFLFTSEDKNKENQNITNITEDNNFTIHEEKVEISNEEKKLVKKTDNESYFLIQECLQNYYVDDQFCIDEIYEQKIDLNKVIYSIYYRLEDSLKSAEDLNMFLKLDKKNKTYLVYEHEFLSRNNMLNLKNGDRIYFDGLEEDIKLDGENKFDDSNIDINYEICMMELFQRYKFDLAFDTEKIYNKLDENYKNERFKTYDIFKNYINDNNEELINDQIIKYKVYNMDEYTQFIGVGESGRNYIFNVNNLMHYNIILDKYSIDTPEFINIYQSNMPSVRAKYCIDRVRKAINDKNYKYVYDRLDIVLKNNYYKNYNDFENFLKTAFFEKNTFQIGELIMITDNVFQYEVKVIDSTMQSKEIKELTMTVTIKDETDFSISIVK